MPHVNIQVSAALVFFPPLYSPRYLLSEMLFLSICSAAVYFATVIHVMLSSTF